MLNLEPTHWANMKCLQCGSRRFDPVITIKRDENGVERSDTSTMHVTRRQRGHDFRNGWLCSGRCNNQYMRRLRYGTPERHGHLSVQWCKATKRAWLYLGGFVIGAEIALGESFCHVTFGVNNGEHDLNVSLAVPGWAMWLNVELPFCYRFGDREREISIQFHHGSIWWTFWHDPHKWSNKDTLWQIGSLNFMDLIFGKAKHTVRKIREFDSIVKLPEKEYTIHVEIVEDRWKRPRSWRAENCKLSAWVEIPEGIPIPGKGTTEYNYKHDAITGFGSSYLDEGAIVIETIGKIFKLRHDRGWTGGKIPVGTVIESGNGGYTTYAEPLK